MTAPTLRGMTFALLITLGMLALLPTAAAVEPLRKDCDRACQEVDDEHAPWHDSCPGEHTCHSLVEHHHGPAAVVLPTQPSLASPVAGPPAGTLAFSFSGSDALRALERPPRSSR